MAKTTKLVVVSLLLASGTLLYVSDPLNWRGGNKKGDQLSIVPEGLRVKPLENETDQHAAPAEAETLSAQAPMSVAPLFGFVRYADGRPAPATILEAYAFEGPTSSRIVWNRIPARVEASSNGLFEFPHIREGKYAVVATSPEGPRALVREILVRSNEPVCITLEPGILLEGHVMDTVDRSIAGAIVKIENGRPSREPSIPMFAMEVRSDSEGRFLVPGLPAGMYTLESNIPGYWHARKTIELPLREPAVLRLKPATYISGRAYLRDHSHPLRSARMTILKNLPTGFSGGEVTTNDEGEFISKPLHSGQYVVTFKHKCFRPVTLAFNLTEEQPARDIEVVFVDGITVQGTLRNSKGAALPWAQLSYRMERAAHGHSLSSVSDARGQFELRGLEAGTCRVSLDVVDPKLQRMTEATIEVSADPFQSTVVIFDIAPPIVIKATNHLGDCLYGEIVSYSFRGERMSKSSVLPATDENGFVGLLGLPGEGHLTLSAGNREAGTAEVGVELSEVVSPIVLTLEPWGTIVGAVEDRKGHAVSGAEVSIPKTNHRALSKQDGRFKLKLPPQTWDLEVTCGEFGKTVVQGIEVRGGQETEPITVILGETGGGTIHGRVLNPEGKPIRAVDVFIEFPDSPQDRTSISTDVEGRFAGCFDQGRYQIRLRHVDYFLRAPVGEVRPGAQAIDIYMERKPQRVLSGYVFHQGAPIEGAIVRLYQLPEEKYRLPLASWGYRNATDRKGRFEFTQIDPSCVRGIIVAQSRHFALARSEEFEVPPDGTLDGIEVISVPGADLELLAISSDSQPVAGAMVWLNSKGRPPVELQGLTDSSGTWRVPQLPSDTYRAIVYSKRLAAREITSFAWDSDSDPLTIKLEPGMRE